MLDNIENGKVDTGILQRIVDFLKGIFYKMNIAKNFTDNETKVIENAISAYEKALANAVKVDNDVRSGYNNSIESYSVSDYEIPYNERQQLRDYIMRKNHSGKLKAIGWKEIGPVVHRLPF